MFDKFDKLNFDKNAWKITHNSKKIQNVITTLPRNAQIEIGSVARRTPLLSQPVSAVCARAWLGKPPMHNPWETWYPRICVSFETTRITWNVSRKFMTTSESIIFFFTQKMNCRYMRLPVGLGWEGKRDPSSPAACHGKLQWQVMHWQGILQQNATNRGESMHTPNWLSSQLSFG